MTLSPHGLAFAALFLALGIIELYVFMRMVYPLISQRHEFQKVTQEQGRSPRLITNVIRLQSLIVMPVLGYFVGSQFMSPGAL
jgi:hypothetical protein